MGSKYYTSAVAKTNTAYRKRLKLRGLCVNGCGTAAEKGRKQCRTCLNVARARRKKTYYNRIDAATCIYCSLPSIPGKRFCQAHLEHQNAKSREGQRRLKLRVFAHYGQICKWPGCGITDADVLTIDHVNNDGAHERRENPSWGSGKNFYRSIERREFPSSYQVLCANHQFKKLLMLSRDEILPTEVTNGSGNT